MTTRRLPVLLGVAAMLGVACSGQPGSDHAQSLIVDPPSGYTVNSNASGPLASVTTAAQLMPTAVADTSAELTAQGFQGGYVRVYTSGAKFVTIIALDFAAGAGATSFAGYENRQITSLQTVFVVPAPSIPGASLYEIAGGTRANSNNLQFCQGVIWADATTYMDVVTCMPPPVSPLLAEQIAVREYQREGGTPAAASP